MLKMYNCDDRVPMLTAPPPSLDKPYDKDDKIAALLGEHRYQNCSISVTRGDYSTLMERMIENLEKAKVRGEGRRVGESMVQSYEDP